MTRSMSAAVLFGFVLTSLSCAGDKEHAAGSSAGAPPAVAAQIERGKVVFGANCARCHGDSGQGTNKAPRIVGLDAGALPLDPPAERKVRKSQFRTAMDVAQFAVANMPPAPSPKLDNADYWAVLAFDLHANGVKLTEPVGPGNAASIVIHP